MNSEAKLNALLPNIWLFKINLKPWFFFSHRGSDADSPWIFQLSPMASQFLHASKVKAFFLPPMCPDLRYASPSAPRRNPKIMLFSSTQPCQSVKGSMFSLLTHYREARKYIKNNLCELEASFTTYLRP